MKNCILTAFPLEKNLKAKKELEKKNATGESQGSLVKN